MAGVRLRPGRADANPWGPTRRLVPRRSDQGAGVVECQVVRLVTAKILPFFLGDAGDAKLVASVVAGLQSKLWLVHLASRVDASRQFTSLPQHFKDHIHLALNLMQVLSGHLAGVCFASSLEVYGTPLYLPIDEAHPTVPFNLYGAGKLNTEHLIRVSCERLEIPACILRLSHIYGPGEHHRKAIPVFIKACLEGSSISLQGNGDDSRDFVHTNDVSHAIALAIESSRMGIFNISGGRSVRMRELVGYIQELCSRRVEVIAVPRERPKLQYAFDLTAAKEGLGYEPTVNLMDGLLSEIRWLQNRGT